MLYNNFYPHYDNFNIVSNDVIKIYTNGYDALYTFKEDKSLWSWSSSYSSNYYNDDPIIYYSKNPRELMEDVADFEVGGNISYDSLYVIKEDRSLWVWGYNYYGQLGDGTTTNIRYPKQIMNNVDKVVPGYNCAFVIKKDKTLWSFGSGYNYH